MDFTSKEATDSSSSAGTMLNPTELKTYNDSIPPLKVGKNRTYEACTHIGLRPSQEDRFVLIPKFFSEDACFAGVFDGTVGPDASDFCMRNVTAHLCSQPEMAEIVAIIKASSASATSEDTAAAAPATAAVSNETIAKKINSAMRNTFLNTDRALINMCAEKQLHYASSTGDQKKL
jgi:serine/threonine protein phosphatase PrpC